MFEVHITVTVTDEAALFKTAGEAAVKAGTHSIEDISDQPFDNPENALRYLLVDNAIDIAGVQFEHGHCDKVEVSS